MGHAKDARLGFIAHEVMDTDPVAARLPLKGLHRGGKGGRSVVQDEACDGLSSTLNGGTWDIAINRALVDGLANRWRRA